MMYQDKKDNFARNFAIFFLTLVVLIVYFVFTDKSEAAIIKIHSNIDSLPYYLNGDDVIHFEFVSDTATTTNNNTFCIRPANGSCATNAYAVNIVGNNYATDTDEITGSTTQNFSYAINVPLDQLFDSNGTTSVDIAHIVLVWGGLNVYQYRATPYASSNVAQGFAFHYDKYGRIPVATNKYSIIDIPILNLAVVFLLFILALNFTIPLLKSAKKSKL